MCFIILDYAYTVLTSCNHWQTPSMTCTLDEVGIFSY